MKKIIILNIVNVISLGLILLLSWIFESVPIGIILLILWFLYVFISNYQSLFQKTDYSSLLKKYNKQHCFDTYIKNMLFYKKSIDNQLQTFESYDETNSIRKAYDLIKEQSDQLIQKGIHYMKHYDYVLQPTPTYLKDIEEQLLQLSKKLQELNQLILEIEDTTTSTDITYVDDLLNSMKEMV